MRCRDWTLVCLAALGISVVVLVPGITLLLHEPFYARPGPHALADYLDTNEIAAITGIMLIWVTGMAACWLSSPKRKWNR